jgi:hypothetical protein
VINTNSNGMSFVVSEFGRGGGDRKDKLLNKACALNALQPLPLSNWNKRNRRQAEPARYRRAGRKPTRMPTYFRHAPMARRDISRNNMGKAKGR